MESKAHLTLDQVQKIRLEMQDSLAMAISTVLNDFEHRTGFTPDYIDVRLIDVTTLGDVHPQHRVGSVEVELPLKQYL